MPLRAGNGDPHRVQDLEQDGHLRRQGRRLGLGAVLRQPVRLVRRHSGDPEGRPPVQVEAGDQPGRPGVPHDPCHQVEGPPHRVDGEPSGAVIVSGTPWNARYHSEGASRSVS
jgi:hypothetical protein